MEFLKKHYEKMVLCVVLLGLATAVLLMKSAREEVAMTVKTPPAGPPPVLAPPTPLDLTNGQQALAQITNPPSVVWSGAHNLFNPVTWKRKSNGDLLKIIKTGPDALIVTNITPLYMVITYSNAMDGPLYVMGLQEEVDLQHPSKGTLREFLSKDQKKKGVPFIVRGTKGAETEPSELNLELIDTGETNIWVSTNTPFQRVESYVADLKYDPESLSLRKQKVKDELTLDNEPYIIVAITNDAVRVQSRRTTQVTEIKWIKSP
jgi:hypothetical protein